MESNETNWWLFLCILVFYSIDIFEFLLIFQSTCKRFYLELHWCSYCNLSKGTFWFKQFRWWKMFHWKIFKNFSLKKMKTDFFQIYSHKHHCSGVLTFLSPFLVSFIITVDVFWLVPWFLSAVFILTLNTLNSQSAPGIKMKTYLSTTLF